MPSIVKRLELGRIQEAIGAHATQREEVAESMRAHPDVQINGRRREGAVLNGQAAGRLWLVEARFRDDMHDETALVSVLGWGDAGNDLHRLHRIG